MGTPFPSLLAIILGFWESDSRFAGINMKLRREATEVTENPREKRTSSMVHI